MNSIIDLRSDTVTQQTEEMRKAMYEAQVGDDVYGNDPTMNELERLGAEIMGKEACIFVPSGTMGNQLCLYCNAQRGDEVISQRNHHVFKFEGAGLAVLSGAQIATLNSYKGCYDMHELEEYIRPMDDIHQPRTKIICLEQTHNVEGGEVVPLEHMREVKKLAEKYRIKVHLDGARIFHAATYLGVDVKEIAKYADTVMFCLSKGLCSPVGSLIAGDKEFIERAVRARKMFGGGMRQSGFLAACGIISLKKMVNRLDEDHANAKRLAVGMNKIDGLSVNPDTVKTNIVMLRVEKGDEETFLKKLRKKGVWASTTKRGTVRFIPHYGITEEDIDRVIAIAGEIMEK